MEKQEPITIKTIILGKSGGGKSSILSKIRNGYGWDSKIIPQYKIFLRFFHRKINNEQ